MNIVVSLIAARMLAGWIDGGLTVQTNEWMNVRIVTSITAPLSLPTSPCRPPHATAGAALRLPAAARQYPPPPGAADRHDAAAGGGGAAAPDQTPAAGGGGAPAGERRA